MATVLDAPPVPRRRPLGRRVMHVVRRGHLFLGLFLFPWAVLYGVTAFLFNHPTAFADRPSTSFGRDALVGTPMESPQPPAEVAAAVVAGLNARTPPGPAVVLVSPEKAAYTREFAFATVAAGGKSVSVLVDVTGAGGTVRDTPPPPAEAVKAPFAVGRAEAGGRGPRGGAGVGGKGPRSEAGIAVDSPLHERVKAAVPVVLDRTGFPAGEVTVTSVPDLTFAVESDGKLWQATYNAQTGTVSGKPAEAAGDGPSVRRFLTRLHVAHGYPAAGGPKWYWAVIVDAMAFVMVFWGVSGLCMWWQIKATRVPGACVLLLSAAAAAALSVGMYDVIRAG